MGVTTYVRVLYILFSVQSFHGNNITVISHTRNMYVTGDHVMLMASGVVCGVYELTVYSLTHALI